MKYRYGTTNITIICKIRVTKYYCNTNKISKISVEYSCYKNITSEKGIVGETISVLIE
jgi:predicted nucleic acid-binding Zn finger protein